SWSGTPTTSRCARSGSRTTMSSRPRARGRWPARCRRGSATRAGSRSSAPVPRSRSRCRRSCRRTGCATAASKSCSSRGTDRVMSKLLHLLKSPWTIALIGIGLLSILVWVAGPYLAFAGREPFAGAVARLLVIVLMVAVWGTCLLVAILRERSKSKRIGGEIAAQEGGAEDADAAGHERALLESRFREAVKMLRKRRGAGSLYKLPWYMVIGPPGSGKSTL